MEAIKYHAGSFVRQAGQRARVGVTSLSQLRHFIEFAAKKHKRHRTDFHFVLFVLFCGSILTLVHSG